VNTVEYDGNIDITSTAPGEAMVTWIDTRDTPTVSSGGIFIAKIDVQGIVPVHPLAQYQPHTLSLGGPYPNPANTSSLIECSLSVPSAVRVTLVDIGGHEVCLLDEGRHPAGEFYVPVDTSPLAAGSYFIVAKAGEETAHARLLVARK